MLRKERTAVPGQIQLYSVEEVAELLDVSKKLVYAWVSDGALRAKRLGPGGTPSLPRKLGQSPVNGYQNGESGAL